MKIKTFLNLILFFLVVSYSIYMYINSGMNTDYTKSIIQNNESNKKNNSENFQAVSNKDTTSESLTETATPENPIQSILEITKKTTPTPTPKKTSTPTPNPTTASQISGVTSEEQQMLEYVNSARANVGAAPLKFDLEIVKVARIKAQDMIDNNYFDHISPTYGSPFDMMSQFKITYMSAGENIAGNSSVKGAFDAWMNSQGHRENIERTGYNYTGIGIVNGSRYGKIHVQLFVGR